LCDHRVNAMINGVAEVELHDEIIDWLDILNDHDWVRVVVIVDRLADLGSRARIARARRPPAGCPRRYP